MSRVKIRLKETEPPEGYKFTQEFRVPYIGEYRYNIATKKAVRMDAGMVLADGFILEPLNPLPEEYRKKKVCEVNCYPQKHLDFYGFMYKGVRFKLHEAVSIEGFFGYLYSPKPAEVFQVYLDPVIKGVNGPEFPVAVLFSP